MAGGRPIEYKGDETVKRVREYIDSCIDEEYERIKSEGKGGTSYDNLIKVKIPTIEGLSVFLGINRGTVYEWQKTYPEFSNIIDELQAIQANKLMEGGLSGTYNPTISKVLLAKHGYHDKQEVENTGNININVVKYE